MEISLVDEKVNAEDGPLFVVSWNGVDISPVVEGGLVGNIFFKGRGHRYCAAFLALVTPFR